MTRYIDRSEALQILYRKAKESLANGMPNKYFAEAIEEIDTLPIVEKAP